MGRNTGRGKIAYSWISPDPAKAGPTLGGGGGGVVVVDVGCLMGNQNGGVCSVNSLIHICSVPLMLY